jgi:hypothetical protein
MVITAIVLIERRFGRIEGRIKTLEDNPLLIAFKEYEILHAKRIIDPDENLKRWEKVKRDNIVKEDGDTIKDGDEKKK